MQISSNQYEFPILKGYKRQPGDEENPLADREVRPSPFNIHHVGLSNDFQWVAFSIIIIVFTLLCLIVTTAKRQPKQS